MLRRFEAPILAVVLCVAVLAGIVARRLYPPQECGQNSPSYTIARTLVYGRLFRSSATSRLSRFTIRETAMYELKRDETRQFSPPSVFQHGKPLGSIMRWRNDQERTLVQYQEDACATLTADNCDLAASRSFLRSLIT